MDLLAWVSHGAERTVQPHMRRIGITAGRASALLSWGQSLDDNERHETGEHLDAEAILRPMLFVYFSEAATCNLLVHDTDHQIIKGPISTSIVRMLLP